MIALYDNIPYVAKSIKRLFLPHNFWGRLEPEGYFSREIMMADGGIIPITEKYMEDLTRKRFLHRLSKQ